MTQLQVTPGEHAPFTGRPSTALHLKNNKKVVNSIANRVMNKNQSENQFGSKSKRPSLPIEKNGSYKDLKTAAHEYAEDVRKQDHGFGFSKN